MTSAGSTHDGPAASGTTPRSRRSMLRELAASLPSFDQALDDFIARAHQTELAVGEDDVIAETAAPGASAEPATAERLGQDAEARDAAVREQLAGLQRRLAEAEQRDQALRGQLAGLHDRLTGAEPGRAGARAAPRRWIWLAIAGAFAAGLAAMFAVSQLVLGRAESPAGAPGAGVPGAGVSGAVSDPARSAPPPAAVPEAPRVVPAPVPAAPEAPRAAPTPVPAAASSHGPANPVRPARAPLPGRQRVTDPPQVHDAAPAAAPATLAPATPTPVGELVDPFAGPSAGSSGGSSSGSAGGSAAGSAGSATIINPF